MQLFWTPDLLAELMTLREAHTWSQCGAIMSDRHGRLLSALACQGAYHKHTRIRQPGYVPKPDGRGGGRVREYAPEPKAEFYVIRECRRPDVGRHTTALLMGDPPPGRTHWAQA